MGVASSCYDNSILPTVCRDRSTNQKNFQLIIISHDEDFVNLISRSGYAECYYKVMKDVG